MDNVLKIVYDNWYTRNGAKSIMQNGIPAAVVTELQKRIIEQNIDHYTAIKQLEQEGVNLVFCESHVMGYCRQNSFPSIDISQVVDDECVYLYPIEVRYLFSKLYTKSSFTLHNNTYTYSLKDTLPLNILKLLQIGKLKLLIGYVQEPFHNPLTVYSFEEDMKLLNIDPSNVIIVSGAYFKEYYKVYPTSKIRFAACEYLVAQQFAKNAHTYPKVTDIGYVSDLVRESDLNSSKYRQKRFLCFNRTLKPHRFVMAYYALKYGILEDNIFSFINDLGHSTEFIFQSIKKLAGVDTDIMSLALTIKNMLPYELDTQSTQNKHGFNIENNKKEFYLETYVHLTTETCFETTDIFFSEKTWRPMLNLQPFIYLGNPGAIRKLQDLGFKTFHPFIDESYDDETTPSKRIQLVRDEILKLHNMPIAELHDWYYSITDILIHNQKHFLNYFTDLDPLARPFNEIVNFYKG
jgi:hypothetical protein